MGIEISETSMEFFSILGGGWVAGIAMAYLVQKVYIKYNPISILIVPALVTVFFTILEIALYINYISAFQIIANVITFFSFKYYLENRIEF